MNFVCCDLQEGKSNNKTGNHLYTVKPVQSDHPLVQLNVVIDWALFTASGQLYGSYRLTSSPSILPFCGMWTGACIKLVNCSSFRHHLDCTRALWQWQTALPRSFMWVTSVLKKKAAHCGCLPVWANTSILIGVGSEWAKLIYIAFYSVKVLSLNALLVSEIRFPSECLRITTRRERTRTASKTVNGSRPEAVDPNCLTSRSHSCLFTVPLCRPRTQAVLDLS